MVTHACNLDSRETKLRGLLGVSGQLRLEFNASLGSIAGSCATKQNKTKQNDPENQRQIWVFLGEIDPIA